MLHVVLSGEAVKTYLHANHCTTDAVCSLVTVALSLTYKKRNFRHSQGAQLRPYLKGCISFVQSGKQAPLLGRFFPQRRN